MAAAPAGATQNTPTTFGTNLSAFTAENDFTCNSFPLPISLTETSCTFGVTGIGVSNSGTFYVPAGPKENGEGTITGFNVKMGSSVGEMQILLLETLREKETQTAGACCKVVDATSIFTPKPNAITHIPVHWTTEYDNVPNPESGVFAFDSMAVSVGGGSPLPIASEPAAIDGYWAPACPGFAGQECFYEGGYEGYVILMDAEWEPTAAPPSTPCPAGDTGTYPSCAAPTPPAPPPTCPAGFSGTPPYCIKFSSASIPVNTALPVITGKNKNKGKLTASAGSWTGSTPITYKYQWEVCNSKGKKCKAIRGATKKTFTISSKYSGKRLEVVVTASNSLGTAKSVASKLTPILK